MKKLLLLMLALAIIMPAVFADNLTAFDIDVTTDPVLAGEPFTVQVTALNESTERFYNFNGSVNVFWGGPAETMNLVNGQGSKSFSSAPTTNFTLTVSNGTVVNSTYVIVEEEKLFYIDEVEINGEKIDLGDYNNGDDITVDAKDVFGEELEVKVTLKNEDDQDMEDVELTVEIEDIDDEGDWEEKEYDVGTVKDDDEETVTITDDIDWTSDEETFQVNVYVTGEGEDDGDDHEDEWTFYLKIDKEDDDLEITNAQFSDDSVEPGDIAHINIEITNIGSDDQDEVTVFIECEDLDFDYVKTDIDLDEGDNYDFSASINVDLDVDADTYSCKVMVFFDWGDYLDEDPDDVEIVDLIVEEVEEEEDEEEEIEEEVVIILPPQGDDDDGGFFGIPTTEEISFTETTAYTILLVLGNILIVVMILFVLIKLFR